MILIVILMCVVIGLVIAVIALPGFNIPAVPTPVPTLPSGKRTVSTRLTEMAAPTLPPVVRVESIVITGGALVLIVLGLILREILLYRKRVSQKEGDGQNPAVLKK